MLGATNTHVGKLVDGVKKVYCLGIRRREGEGEGLEFGVDLVVLFESSCDLVERKKI